MKQSTFTISAEKLVIEQKLTTASLLLRNPRISIGISIVGFMIILGMAAPYLSPYDPLAMTLSDKLLPPSLQNPFGTDPFGRDVLSRLIWGARISLFVGVISVATGMTIGVMLGTIAGYFMGWVDMLIGRVLDVLLALPSLVLAIAISAALGANMLNLMIAIGIAVSPNFARIVRSTTLSIKENQYVEAAKSLALSDRKIMFRHILPHAMPSIVVYATLLLGSAITIEASLSFLGIGIQPPTPSWGQMVEAGSAYLQVAPWVSTVAGFFILITVLGFNLLGDGLRDFIDPRLSRGMT